MRIAPCACDEFLERRRLHLPSIIGHAAVGLAASLAVPPQSRSWRVVALAATCSVLPDLDTIGFWYGIPYDHWLGHRGFLHGHPFALAAGILAAWLAKPCPARRMQWLALAALFTLCTASHGLLDAATSGGLGIAFFSPFSGHRFFLPWRPIAVAPLNPARMLSPWGVRVLASELIWVEVPALCIALALWASHRWRQRVGFHNRATNTRRAAGHSP
ncbi:MAG: metal-dependent hydrolase [Acidobacteriota bacterium]